MKKLFFSFFIASSISSSFASMDAGDYVRFSTSAGVATTLVANPMIGVAVGMSSIAVMLPVLNSVGLYQGLDNDAVDVLAGSIKLEDSAALSMFKEDILENKEAIEAEFQANKIDLTVEELTDEEIAQLAIASSIK